LEALEPLVAATHQAATKAGEAVKKYTMPKPFSERPLDQAKMVPGAQAQLDANWKKGEKSPAGRFPSVIASDVPGAKLTLSFTGDCVGIFDSIGPDTGDLEFSLDGGDWKPFPNFDLWCKDYHRTHCRVIAANLDSAKPHELKLRVAEQQPKDSKGRFTRIGFFLVNGEVTGGGGR
jgi:hypothetical protein